MHYNLTTNRTSFIHDRTVNWYFLKLRYLNCKHQATMKLANFEDIFEYFSYQNVHKTLSRAINWIFDTNSEKAKSSHEESMDRTCIQCYSAFNVEGRPEDPPPCSNSYLFEDLCFVILEIVNTSNVSLMGLPWLNIFVVLQYFSCLRADYWSYNKENCRQRKLRENGPVETYEFLAIKLE